MYYFAARQPILDREQKLFAYELLFRESLDNVFPQTDLDEATSKLIESSQLNYGLEDMSAGKPAFVNFTLETLSKGYAKLVSPEQLVVEIIETVPPGKRLLALCKELKELGYTLVLDDYRHKPVWQHFFPLIDLIKIDVLETTEDEWAEIKHATSAFPHIKFVAEKVETHEQFQHALQQGFDYFQGFFFARPEVVKSKAPTPSQMTLAELLYESSNSEMDLNKITEIFARDVNLSYKLLRYSNSAIFKRRTEISTIKQALVVLGIQELKRFLSVLFTSQVSSEKPAELVRLALTRARFAECLAETHNSSTKPSTAFLAGMMSLIDAIMDEPTESIMQKLPLSSEIKVAIVEKEGLLADYIALIAAYESARWDEANEIKEVLGLDPTQVPHAYHTAVNWANQQMDSLI